MAGELDSLRSEVARNTTVNSSAIALLQGLKSQLDGIIAGGVDPAAVASLATELGANTDALAAAVAANTPAAPPPPPAPPSP